MQILLATLTLLVAATIVVEGRVFERCALVTEITGLGVPKEDALRLACIAENESGLNTEFISIPTAENHRGHGLFNLNSQYWCQPDPPAQSSNACNVSCNQLRTDDIKDAVTCARLVITQQGWNAWNSNSRSCAGSLPECP